MALQLMAMNGLSLRGLSWWMARATISLPVPLCPVITTLAFEGATFSTSSIALPMVGDKHVGLRLRRQLEPAVPVAGLLHLVAAALEQFGEQLAGRLFVVNDQDAGFRHEASVLTWLSERQGEKSSSRGREFDRELA